MKLHKWENLARTRVGDEQLSRLRAQAAAEVAIEMNLPELRQALGKTQVEVAAAAEMAQAKVSEFERRDDHVLSVLRRYIEALGGKLEISAVFDEKRVRLKGV
ncbi:MAG TPA: XRE family transcriptional regulator [Polyangia bacterium]|jgi:predicted subunit of tRNA(5-methylaminomethyl-2-thiouridylate) methyltransferase